VTGEQVTGKAADKLRLAEKHLERVQIDWDDPTDWADLSLYGFYCLENAVEAAAIHFKIRVTRKHWEKADVAHDLHVKHKLPDVSDLLRELNEARKAAAYGDVPAPSLDAEDVASRIEEFVEATKAALG
jgi:hypothetical protein